jgi:hypothetical protein
LDESEKYSGKEVEGTAASFFGVQSRRVDVEAE